MASLNPLLRLSAIAILAVALSAAGIAKADDNSLKLSCQPLTVKLAPGDNTPKTFSCKLETANTKDLTINIKPKDGGKIRYLDHDSNARVTVNPQKVTLRANDNNLLRSFTFTAKVSGQAPEGANTVIDIDGNNGSETVSMNVGLSFIADGKTQVAVTTSVGRLLKLDDAKPISSQTIAISLDTPPDQPVTITASEMGNIGMVNLDKTSFQFSPNNNQPAFLDISYNPKYRGKEIETVIIFEGSTAKYYYSGRLAVAIQKTIPAGGGGGGGGNIDSANPCSDATSGSTRDCTLSERIADPNGYVYSAWQAMRGAINIILILALLLISFSNILRINIDTYAVKKALPNLVIGVVLANASFLIIRYMADISSVAVQFFVERTGSGTFSVFVSQTLTNIGVNAIETIKAVATLPIINILIVLVMTIIALVGILWLAFLLYFRLVAIYLLTILAPLAFVAYGIPGFDKYFKQWWQQFIKWLFILPAMSALFWVMFLIGNAGGDNQSIARTITQFLIFFTALGLPSKMGGAIIDKASNAFKKTGNFALDKSGAKDLGRDLGSRAANRVGITRLQEWNKLRKENLENTIKGRRDRASISARRGRAGLAEAQLAKASTRTADDLATIKALNEERYFETPEGKEELRKAVESEVKKRTAEAERNNTQLEVKLDFVGDKKNEAAQKLMKELYTQLFNEKRGNQALELEENIKVGDMALSRIEPLQAAENWLKHKKEHDHLNDKNDEDGSKRAALVLAMNKEQQAYDALRQQDDNKKEFGGKGIDEVATEFDKPTGMQGRLWKATHSQGRKIFNEGLVKQNEQLIKEGTAAEINAQTTEFKQKLLDEFGEADGKKMMKLFMSGRTAELQLQIDAQKKKRKDAKEEYNGPSIRDGMLAVEAQKKLMNMSGDVRNPEILESFIAERKESGLAPLLIDGEPLDLKQMDKREYRNKVSRVVQKESEILAGSPNARYHKEPVEKPPPPPPEPKPAPPPPAPRPEDYYSAADIERAGGKETIAGFGENPTSYEEAVAEYERQYGQQQNANDGKNEENEEEANQDDENPEDET